MQMNVEIPDEIAGEFKGRAKAQNLNYKDVLADLIRVWLGGQPKEAKLNRDEQRAVDTLLEMLRDDAPGARVGVAGIMATLETYRKSTAPQSINRRRAV